MSLTLTDFLCVHIRVCVCVCGRKRSPVNQNHPDFNNTKENENWTFHTAKTCVSYEAHKKVHRASRSFVNNPTRKASSDTVAFFGGHIYKWLCFDWFRLFDQQNNLITRHTYTRTCSRRGDLYRSMCVLDWSNECIGMAALATGQAHTHTHICRWQKKLSARSQQHE